MIIVLKEMGKQNCDPRIMILDLAAIQQYHFLMKIILLEHTSTLRNFFDNFNFSYINLNIFAYCLSCSMNCYVIYLVFAAKLELQNDYSFDTDFSLEINFKLLFSHISTF